MIIEPDFKHVPRIATPCNGVKPKNTSNQEAKHCFGKPVKQHIKENFKGYF